MNFSKSDALFEMAEHDFHNSGGNKGLVNYESRISSLGLFLFLREISEEAFFLSIILPLCPLK